MGHKKLTVELQGEINEIPSSLQKYNLVLGNNKKSLDYTYNLNEKQTGITNLLQDIKDTGLKLRYYLLKEIIKSVKPYGIAIIIAMANREDCDELFCSYLPDFSINPINLTYCGIARRLIDDYISKDEVEKLCNKIPNYEGILRNLRTSKERQGKRTPRETPLHCSH